MNKKIISIVFIILLISTGIFLYFKLRFECGDKVCEIHELTTCASDCKSECNQSIVENLEGILSNNKIIKLIRDECSINWDDTYTESRINQKIPDDYVLRTIDYDYDNLNLQNVIDEINNKNIKETEKVAKEVGDYVYFNIEYKKDLTYLDCLLNKASDVNNRGFGVCSTMSKVDISILRGLGIATRPVVGCVSLVEDYKCRPLKFEKGIAQAIGFFERKPKIQPIEINNEGIAISKGGLHTWLEVWLPEKGWVILEPTTGYLIDSNCESYKKLKIPNELEFCGLNAIQYNEFINECRNF